MKFPFTRKIWEIFLSQAKSGVKALFIFESLENRLPVVNFICRWVITVWVKAFFFQCLMCFLYFYLLLLSVMPLLPPPPEKDPGAFCWAGGFSSPSPPQELQMLCFVLELIQKWTILIVQQCYPNTMLWEGLRWKSACNLAFIIFSNQFGNGPHLTVWSWLWHLPWVRAKNPDPLSVLLFTAQ